MDAEARWREDGMKGVGCVVLEAGIEDDGKSICPILLFGEKE